MHQYYGCTNIIFTDCIFIFFLMMVGCLNRCAWTRWKIWCRNLANKLDQDFVIEIKLNRLFYQKILGDFSLIFNCTQISFSVLHNLNSWLFKFEIYLICSNIVQELQLMIWHSLTARFYLLKRNVWMILNSTVLQLKDVSKRYAYSWDLINNWLSKFAFGKFWLTIQILTKTVCWKVLSFSCFWGE